MINLYLPAELQYAVRHDIMRLEPSLKTQFILQEFMDYITPSLQYKALSQLYKNVLLKCIVFKNYPEEAQIMLDHIEIRFFSPEESIIAQYDHRFRAIYVTGQGLCTVYLQFTTRQRYTLGKLCEGSIIGEAQVIFDSDPPYSVESSSYSTVGCITQ